MFGLKLRKTPDAASAAEATPGTDFSAAAQRLKARSAAMGEDIDKVLDGEALKAQADAVRERRIMEAAREVGLSQQTVRSILDRCTC